MFRIFAAALLLSLSSNAMAAGWIADRVRGEVLVDSGSGWAQVVRGIEIGDGARLKTGANGRVDLNRDNDHFSLGANTSVQIRDSGADLMTSLIQSAGTVSVDVERRNVQHFSVQTPFLAAVVKGTRFTVTSDTNGSHVDVDRGVVQVQDSSNDLVANVGPGQEAGVTAEAPLQVEGAGAKPVYTSQGVIVSTVGNKEASAKTDTPEISASQTAAQKQNGQGGNNGRGNGVGNGSGDGKTGTAAGSGGNDNGNGGGNNGNGKNGGGNNANGNGGGNNGNGNGGGNNGNGNDGGNNGNGNGGGNNGNGNGGGNNGNGNGGGNDGNGNGGGNNGNGNGGGNNGNGNGGGNNGNGNGDGNNGNGGSAGR